MTLSRGPLRVSVGPWCWGALPPRPPGRRLPNPSPKPSTKSGQVQSFVLPAPFRKAAEDRRVNDGVRTAVGDLDEEPRDSPCLLERLLRPTTVPS